MPRPCAGGDSSRGEGGGDVVELGRLNWGIGNQTLFALLLSHLRLNPTSDNILT